MATSPVSPASKAPFTRAPFSRAPESVAPLSRFPGTGSGKTSSRKSADPLEAVGKQLRWAGALLLVLLVAAAALVYTGQQQAEQSLAQQSAIADMRLMSQGIGRAAVLAVAGQAPGFAQLREAKDSFPQQLGSLGEADERFQGVINAWTQVAKDISTLQNQEKPLIAMGRVASVFDGQAAPLVDLSEQLLMMQKKTGGHPREIEATAQMVGLAGRITRNAGLLLTSDPVRQELAVQLDQDGAAMAKLVDALKNGSDAPRYGPISQPDQRTLVLMLDKAFVEFQGAATSLLGNIQVLKEARLAGGRLQKGADSLTAQTLNLSRDLQAASAERLPHGTLALMATVLALLVALGIAVLYQKDAKLRQEATRAQRHGLEKANKQNQDAILRLMDELGNLANGDLTVKATVNEDITGAIADSVNCTVDEFRGAVQRINKASERVAEATGGARETSAQLLEAAKEQSSQIHQAGVSALEMAQSMNHVSADANRSAQVARKSLTVAQHGAQAVQDAMKGMNSIRDQIQETSKRIKRLGDSSLEIGEIVEMISDITEQTHVLALNAAIQAASAGEAGRGFTVVAEEVQRLAERSGEATRQIAGIVKTIQADTRNAVAAMERSTLDVVEGAKLSDAAGQALTEVGEVSSQMAGLIDSISLATQKQSNTATQVAKRMKDILKITEQTSGGTQQTTQAVAELDKLVAELKASVAGFKVN